MVELCVLGSGSKGNATLVRTERSALLIDAGLSARQLSRRLEVVGQDPDRLDAILLTHEHSDHIAGVRVFRKRRALPLVANDATLAASEGVLGESIAGEQLLETGSSLAIEDFRITSFGVPHDAAETVGYLLEAEGVRIGYATDLGHVTRLVRERLQGCEILVVEANHDRQMLLDGPYPWPTKQRVASRHGHLSNDHTATLLPEIIGERTEHVILAHLSETNNDPLLALSAVRGAFVSLNGGGPTFEVARQDRPSRLTEVRGFISPGR